MSEASDNGIANKLSQQWHLFKQAPIPYLSGIALVAGLMFMGSKWIYGRVVDDKNAQIDEKNAQIETLKGRLEAEGVELAEANRKLSVLQKPSDANVSAGTSERDPDALYQLGEQTAKVVGASLNLASHTVFFSYVMGNGDLDIDADADYNRYRITQCQHGTVSSSGMYGTITSVVYTHVTCEVAGIHP